MDKSLSYKKNALFFQIFVTVLSVLFLLLAFIPIILMLTLSLKSNVQIYGNFWSLPWPIQWSNYRVAVDTLIPNMVNSMVLVTVSTFFTVLLSSTSGYVFARLQFPGKNLLFYLILSLMMVPGILTLTPLYKLMQDLHLTNNWLALIFPWVSGGQVFGILLCRTFLSNQPAALFESARMDGATELAAYYKIALPLAKPILATLAIMNLMGFYNDFIWPLMVIDNNSRQVITVAIRVFQSMTGSIDLGSMVAGFVFSSIPLLILFMFGSRLYIEGVTSGAIKT
jgi:ABC-type glycerol-3-phosphate transport system permease component